MSAKIEPESCVEIASHDVNVRLFFAKSKKQLWSLYSSIPGYSCEASFYTVNPIFPVVAEVRTIKPDDVSITVVNWQEFIRYNNEQIEAYQKQITFVRDLVDAKPSDETMQSFGKGSWDKAILYVGQNLRCRECNTVNEAKEGTNACSGCGFVFYTTLITAGLLANSEVIKVRALFDDIRCPKCSEAMIASPGKNNCPDCDHDFECKLEKPLNSKPIFNTTDVNGIPCARCNKNKVWGRFYGEGDHKCRKCGFEFTVNIVKTSDAAAPAPQIEAVASPGPHQGMAAAISRMHAVRAGLEALRISQAYDARGEGIGKVLRKAEDFLGDLVACVEGEQ